MDHKKTFSSPAAAVVVMASLAMMSTSALGACKTTLRGELVQAPAAPVLRQAHPEKFLFFYLVEMTPASGFRTALSVLRGPEYKHHASHSVRVEHRFAQELSERS
jgi:hypothetical protein